MQSLNVIRRLHRSSSRNLYRSRTSRYHIQLAKRINIITTKRYYLASSYRLENKKDEDEDPEANLPPELQNIKPLPASFWVISAVLMILAYFFIPWKSWKEHIFSDDDDDDD